MRTALFVISGLLASLLLAVFWKQSNQPKPVALTPTLTGQVEYCLTCHSELDEISPSHPLSTFGCVVCHGGERLALDAELAHSSMRGGKNPSDLSVVEASCGGSVGGANCHSGSSDNERDHIQRVSTSLQATYAGAIANMRYTFGAQPDLTARQGVQAIQAPESKTGIQTLQAFDPAHEKSPALQAFGANCLDCHLSAVPRSGVEYARFTGCAACHTPNAGEGQNEPGANIHRLTTRIAYSQCNTCHNRGNYDLRSMKFIPRQDKPVDRLHDYYQPIARFTSCEYTLDCVDCHTRQEAMGNGNLYSSKKESQYVRCSTCHGTLTKLPLTRTLTEADELALRLAFLNPVIDLKAGDTILITEKGEPMWNTRQLPDGTFEMFGKASGQRFVFRPVKGSTCQQDPARQDSNACHECHAVSR
jgi:hypothetical protein